MDRRIKDLAVVLLLFLVIGAFHGNPVQAAEKKVKERLAVLDLEAKYGIDKGLAEALSVIVRDKLHGFGEYEVMSQSDIQAVASRERLKQVLGCDDDGSQCLVDFGRAIGTRFMVAGDISRLGATYTISLRMLDTKGEGASVKNRVSESCKCNEDALIGTAQDVAAKLLGKTTATVVKKSEEEAKKLVEEKSNTAATEQKRLAEERRKAEEEKQRLAVEVEKLQKDRGQAKIKAEQPRVVNKNKPASVASSTNPLSLTNKTHIDPTTGMEFVLVPGGCFQMGDTFGDGQSNEKPVHAACVDAFYLGKYEVTQGQYLTVIGNNPSNFKKSNNYPVEMVSWNDTQNFIRLLNGKSGCKYRLPTEAESEFAARSGGRIEKYAGGNNIDVVAWYKTNSGSSTHPVGQKQPNGLGLYDMTGNVWEWCEDVYESGYYSKSPKSNPEGPSSGSGRANRGGGWYDDPGGARATARNGDTPATTGIALGFRLVLSVERQ
ncbi:MAG: formylglycine-generating enzyme family protein [Pseudomonadota bacterium]